MSEVPHVPIVGSERGARPYLRGSEAWTAPCERTSSTGMHPFNGQRFIFYPRPLRISYGRSRSMLKPSIRGSSKARGTRAAKVAGLGFSVTLSGLGLMAINFSLKSMAINLWRHAICPIT